MSKKTLALIVILLILTVVLVIVAVSTKDSASQDHKSASTAVTQKPTPTDAPAHTLLSMSPNPVYPTTTGSASATTVSVQIDTGGDNVRAVQLEIAYDPALLTGMTIKPGTFFTNAAALPVGGVSAKTGRITYAITSSDIKASKSGTGTVATLSFYPVRNSSVASTPITLLEKSLVTAVGLGTQTVLKQTSGTVVMLSTTPLPTVVPTTPVTQ